MATWVPRCEARLFWRRAQELQADLQAVMALAQRSAEYQLAVYPSNGAQYVRHRDAFPDDGSEEGMRRVRSPGFGARV